VMADGGGRLRGVEQIPNTIERYVRVGAAGINLEDQVWIGSRAPGSLIWV